MTAKEIKREQKLKFTAREKYRAHYAKYGIMDR